MKFIEIEKGQLRVFVCYSFSLAHKPVISNGTLYLARRTRFTESEVALYAGVASGGGPTEVLFSVKSKSELRPGFASVSTA